MPTRKKALHGIVKMHTCHTHRHSLKRLFTQANYQLLSGACLLCGLSAGQDMDLCRACEESIPRLGLHCDICATPLKTVGICGRCHNKRPAFSTVQTPLLYQYPVDLLLQRFKFGGQLAAGKVLSQLLTRHIREQFDNGKCTLPDLLIPVPLHWKKRFLRGFNQSEVITRELSRELKIKHCQRAVKRVINTPAQHHLSKKERQRLPRNTFAVGRAGKVLQGARVVLVDDVLTTGSTVQTLSQTLLKAGAKSVEIWLLARTPLDN
ncbi:MAG: ComF family protein [Porticoccaceae bacterium]|nr:ComF family protein [Porticoccaceae bacterium]